MNIHWFQHVPFEGLGCIEIWSERHKHRLSVTRFHQQDPLPTMETFDWLIVMGGPMNIYEEVKYPWLPMERDFIKKSIENKKVVIGICLGAQLIADALGSKVYPGRHKEIGWYPVRKTNEAGTSQVFRDFPPEMDVFHWHGDTFDLPAGCAHIAESEACPNQAFINEERVIGLQFHIEMTSRGAEKIVSNCREEIVTAPYIQNAEEILSDAEKFTETNKEMDRLLDRLSLQQP
ncbi:MAG: type 1 glutamine amidotransferase [Acidobacteria bacterium]|nr:type 1 glutamine amidotransferase [Acidobacteriota bacterium]